MKCLRTCSWYTAGVRLFKLGSHKRFGTQTFERQLTSHESYTERRNKDKLWHLFQRVKLIDKCRKHPTARRQESAPGLQTPTIRSGCLHWRAGVAALFVVTSTREGFHCYAAPIMIQSSPFVHLFIDCWRSPPGYKSNALGNKFLQIMLNHFLALKVTIYFIYNLQSVL